MKSLRDHRLLYTSFLGIASLIAFAGYSGSRFVRPVAAAPFAVINTNDSGAGSLRQAILDANGSNGLDTISFAIPAAGVQTISLASPLPVITDPVVINGYSQNGASPNTQADTENAVLLIEINGVGTGSGPCLQINAGGSTVRGLVINRCGAAGILLQTGGGNNVEGNFIGIDPTGTINRANAGNGVEINDSPNNTIGGTTPATRNVISGNLLHGVSIGNTGATGNIVAGNFIGTNAAGTDALGNSFQGVLLAANSNTVGGTTAGARNVVSGNSNGGGVTFETSSLNVVQGNYIGLNALGTATVGNGSGIFTLDNASNNLVGGTVAGARNVISGNSIGLSLQSASIGVNTRVEGNFIGTDPGGTVARSNNYGVIIGLGTSNNVIGGTAAGAGNIIAFSNLIGVSISPTSTGNTISSNSIFSNNGLGIDLNNEGVTPNDAGDADTGANSLQNYPYLSSVTSSGGNTTIGGTLNSTPNTSFRIEFFANTAVDTSGFGEGQTFIGSTTVTTDGSGNASFSTSTGSATPTGQFITSTATNNVTKETSEFSSAVQVNGPEAFQFLSPTFTVSENAGTATITVTRTDGASSGTTVNYATSGGTASAGVDYTTTSGTLTFGIGETSKTFTVPIIDDAQIEGDETFNVTLSSPSVGAVLGSPSTATVIIADREQTIYGVTVFNNLISFERANPATIYSKVPITGLQMNEQILGIDFRPSNGQLYGLGSTSRLYTINTTTGAATQVGSGTFTPAITGSDFGFDFDPVADRIRVVSNSDQNLRLDPDTGAVVSTDTTLAYDAADPNVAANPNVVGLAYSNNVAGASSSTLYGIDADKDTLVRIGSPGGTPTSPNSGLLFTVGALGVDTGGFTGFDIPSSGNTGLAVLAPSGFVFTNASQLYSIDLTTGATTNLGFVGGFILAETVRGIATVTNGSIALSSATANVSEGAGKVQITVNRTGDISGAASVDFATSDGTAQQTTDYNIGFGTVIFAPGEASKTFNVFITDDGFVEAGETFNVTLSNPKGGFQLGAVTTATVTIADNDLAPSVTNPIDSTPFFVRQQYVDFLNREPDASGFNFWTNEITSCGANAQCIEVKRINVSAAFFLSIEFQRTGALVYLTHKAAVGLNFPAPAPVPVLYQQFEHDTQTIQQGLTFGQPNFDATLEVNKQAFFADFVSRPQFGVTFPTTQTPQQFVDALIANTGVAFTSAERQAALNEFGGAGTSADQGARARALRRVAENPTFAAAELNRTFVAMEYFGYLRRHPDAPGFNFWLTKLNDFNGNYINAEMVKAFISSLEYRQRFAAN